MSVIDASDDGVFHEELPSFWMPPDPEPFEDQARFSQEEPDSVQCQGCGAVRGISFLGKPHACHRNEAGEMEEGGTFQ